MIPALVTLTLVAAPQLGWRAGTPSPVLDANPEFVQLYWKSWENYHETVVEDIRPQILPIRFSALSAFIEFDKTLAHGFYLKWAYKAAPIESTLRFLAGRVDARGNAPAQIGAEDAVGTGEATSSILMPVLVRDIYELNGDKEFVREMFAACARRNLYFSGSFLETIDNGPKEPATKRWRVPRSMSPVPTAPAPSGLGDSAEALSLLLLEAHTLSALARTAAIPNGEKAYDRIAALRESALKKLWDDKAGWWRGHDSDNEQFEPITIVPSWALMTGRFSDRAPRIGKSLSNPELFGRWLQFPSLAATDERFFNNSGVLPLHQYLTTKALLESGQRYAAGVSAENMLSAYARAAGQNITLFSEYGPDTREPAPFAVADSLDAGLVTIGCLIEGLIGIEVDAENNTISWDVWRLDRHGINNLRFGQNVVSVIAGARASRSASAEISVACERSFKLKLTVTNKTVVKSFAPGEHVWKPL